MTKPPASRRVQPEKLPSDLRFRQGGWIFLVSLVVFFLASILIYLVYAYWRRGDQQSEAELPWMLLVSTGCLVGISAMVHLAVRAIRRERRRLTGGLLIVSALVAVIFTLLQFIAMSEFLLGPAMTAGTGKGVAGMVVVLAFLHALHVVGGVIALLTVAIGSMLGRYDHERNWPVEFTAHYWHFLDIVWLCMLASFCLTTGGFAL